MQISNLMIDKLDIVHNRLSQYCYLVLKNNWHHSMPKSIVTSARRSVFVSHPYSIPQLFFNRKDLKKHIIE